VTLIKHVPKIARKHVAVVHEAIANLDEELEHRDLYRKELLVLKISIESALNYAGIGFQEIVIEELSDQVPGHDSDSRVSALYKSENPAE
jgi:hypothetical protein